MAGRPQWGWGDLGVSSLSLVLSLRWGWGRCSCLYWGWVEASETQETNREDSNTGAWAGTLPVTSLSHTLHVQPRTTVFSSSHMSVAGHPAQL